MGSALLDNAAAISAQEAENSLRGQAAARLAAHRSRRMSAPSADASPGSPTPRNARSARIAAAVAQRYAQTPTYKEFLAVEAERALQQARAAAEVAARNVQALAEAQQDLLHALEPERFSGGEAARDHSAAPSASEATDQTAFALPSLWPEFAAKQQDPARRVRPSVPATSASRQTNLRGRARQERAVEIPSESPAENAAQLVSPETLAAGITIRLYQDASGTTRLALDSPGQSSASSAAAATRDELDRHWNEEEARMLDEEIAFRHEPAFDEPAGPPLPLPANLIEFPRQLVASRKARPRLAEGPLRDEPSDQAASGQLRIFEVEPEQMSYTVTTSDSCAQWTTIMLGSQPVACDGPAKSAPAAPETDAQISTAAGTLPGAASIRRRIFAAAINTAALLAGFALFAAASAWTAQHLSTTRGPVPSLSSLLTRSALETALPFAVCAFALLAACYQALFFCLATATPGMRCARIALCTFGCENPARPAIRRRLLALLLSAGTVGLGFLWVGLDEERLCWHDRICGIYQRSY